MSRKAGTLRKAVSLAASFALAVSLVPAAALPALADDTGDQAQATHGADANAFAGNAANDVVSGTDEGVALADTPLADAAVADSQAQSNSSHPSDAAPSEDSHQAVVQASGFAFTLLPDGTLAVGWAGGDMPAAVSIPTQATIDGAERAVSAIADGGFSGVGSEALVAVSIPESVKSIGKCAFAGCCNLASIGLVEGLESVGEAAFEGTSPDVLVLPKSVRMIGSGALGGMSGATIVALGDVTEVDPQALRGTTGAEVYVPYRESGEYAWSVGDPDVGNPATGAAGADDPGDGLAIGDPDTGNSLLPYGVKLTDALGDMEVGQTIDLFGNGGYLHVPGRAEVSYSYGSAVSVDTEACTVECVAPGSARIDVNITLPLDESAAAGIIQGEARI